MNNNNKNTAEIKSLNYMPGGTERGADFKMEYEEERTCYSNQSSSNNFKYQYRKWDCHPHLLDKSDVE